MKKQPEFVQRYLVAAENLLHTKALKEPIFSRGTYQIEVQERGKKKEFPFLQMKENGEVTDSFCSCELSSSGEGCPHLAAAVLRIFNGFEEPLHVRFNRSLWNRLFQMIAKREGYEPSCLKKIRDAAYVSESNTGKQLFLIEALGVKEKKRLLQIIAEKAPETEETSLKFSNWSPEEIAQFRAGKATPAIRYELSFWMDLAKWLMFLTEIKAPYQIEYEGQPIPHQIQLQFPQLRLQFYISEVHWPWIIPTLKEVSSPLKVFEIEDEAIEKIVYDEAAKSLRITHQRTREENQAPLQGHPLGDWLYVESVGFYLRKDQSLLQNDLIPAEKIASALSDSMELRRFLPVAPEPVKAQYHLFFARGELHIALYVFEPSDLQLPGAAWFFPWAYLPDKGFYRLEDCLFEEIEKVIAPNEMADFINRHRVWLHNFNGFQTHLGSMESHLIYRCSDEGLEFDAALNFPQEYGETLHFDEWVYIQGQGFYRSRERSGKLPLYPGLKIPKEEIASFIAAHKEDLEQIEGFFSSEAFLLKTGLALLLNDEGLITLEPKREYAPGIDAGKVQSFGSYLYLEGKGFSEIPASHWLPEKFLKPTSIPAAQESSFLAYELEPLRPLIASIDPRLKKPQDLRIKIRKVLRDKRKRGKAWLVDLVYMSELGMVDPFALWDALQEKRSHIFSEAGWLSLKDPRFHWIRQLSKRRLDRKKGWVRLTTLEWIRLGVFEEIIPPQGATADKIETRSVLKELQNLETHQSLDISKLKATLRPYQETGLNWLWFLYCHGLSGLLCDDMGLGKTHQTMALLAAISHQDLETSYKYLVVCPTSVIYHWQELLRRFLPHLRVSTYYGVERNLQNFDQEYDLLLTSYGILRGNKEVLAPFSFELAIFDEIQIAKNHASQTHLALRAIQAKMRLGLTGTPIENRIRELKSLFDIVLPSYMPSEAVFRELFVHPIEKFGDEEKKALLAKLVKPFILRRKKSEVLTDLPEKIEEIAYCDLSEEQKKLYLNVVSQMRETIYRDLKDGTKPVSYMHIFSAFMELKQICDHPALVLDDVKNYRKYLSGKWDLFIELLYEARDSGQKIVVFSQYLGMLSIIEAHLKKKGIGYASIKGSTRDRREQLCKFRDDPECRVFVASLLAAGIGIDLTVASIVIHYDRWWNPAKENQATDRVHRMGQNRGVQVFKLVTKNTIEEHIHELIEKKKGLLEQIVKPDDQITMLTREELLEVFEKMFSASGS
jgi:superfamily II DNA or RNA helicase